MRTFFGILLLFCLAAPVVGTYVGLRVEKRRIKKEVKKHLIAETGKAELVYFRFSKKDGQTALRWEHEGEFEYCGQMYDVVKKVIQKDSVLYWCWWDHAETQLNKKLQSLLSWALASDPVRQDWERRAICFFLALYFDEISLPYLQERKAYRYSGRPNGITPLISETVQPPSPPPDRI